jgi:glyoxylase-like metal-dependent hydrolase (beta-lactamase superfamily II)
VPISKYLRRPFTSVAAAGMLVLPITALAQAGPLPRDSTARVQRLADGVYAIIHDDASDQWPHSNTGVVVYEDGVLVVDATYLPSRARADIGLIRALTDKPVRYLVNTHWHMDHTYGNEAYRDAFPEVVILTERATRELSELNSHYWARFSTAPGSPRRKAVEELQAELARGRDSAGTSHSAEEKRRLETVIRQRSNELDELARVRVVVADQVFDGAMTLRLGRRRVELVDHGRANSPHDVTVYLPDERVLFAGDILVQSPLPYTGASWPVPWIDVLRSLERVPVTALVPGHGPVMRDHSYTRQVRELLQAVTAGVARMARQGKPVELIQDSLRLGEVRRKVPVWMGQELDADWDYILRTVIERAWRGVRGQG